MRCAGIGIAAVEEVEMASRAYRVYVIELSLAAGRRRDPRIPWVYVGSSARDPEIRFAQHRRGYKSSGLVKRFALHLRPDLYEDLEPLRSSRLACDAEQARARELARAGFIAHSDGVSYGLGELDWAEWDAARLEPVIGHLDAAIDELAGCAFEPLDPETCALLLHGERGFWVADYLDQDDPPPAYGRFAQVQLSALESRAAERLGPESCSRVASEDQPLVISSPTSPSKRGPSAQPF